MIFFTPERGRKNAPTLVEQTVAALERAIEERRLAPGMALPSIRQFARSHALSTFTVASAYGRLVARGLVQSQPGANFRVVQKKAPPPASVPKWVMPRLGATWLLADVFADHSISIKAGCGWLPPEWYADAGLAAALRTVSRAPTSQVSSYGHPLGYHPLREYLARHLQQYGLELEAEQILLTHGATQALDIVVRTLLRPGDHVALEAPCYANLLQIFALNQIIVHPVARTHEGICTQALKELAGKHPLRAIFVTTVLQNPTGASFSMAGAFRLLQLAEQFDFLVIEDDVSRELLTEPGPVLAALAGSSRVIYVSGFSKSIMPATRVGYLACAGPILEQCTRTKMSLGLSSAQLMERAVLHMLRDGRHGAYMRGLRARLHAAHQEVLLQMQRHGFSVWVEPGAGLFIWAKPPFALEPAQLSALIERALKAGIWLAPGSYFDPAGAHTGWLRFNVAYSTSPKLWQFFQTERERALGSSPKPAAKAADK